MNEPNETKRPRRGGAHANDEREVERDATLRAMGEELQAIRLLLSELLASAKRTEEHAITTARASVMSQRASAMLLQVQSAMLERTAEPKAGE